MVQNVRHYLAHWLTNFLMLVSRFRPDTKEPVSVHTGKFPYIHWYTFGEIPYFGEHTKYLECGAFNLYGFQDTNTVYLFLTTTRDHYM